MGGGGDYNMGGVITWGGYNLGGGVITWGGCNMGGRLAVMRCVP